MNCNDIERALQRVQAQYPEEHLPLESILGVLHDEEFASGPFTRWSDVPFIYGNGRWDPPHK